jgi:hypothetical protein
MVSNVWELLLLIGLSAGDPSALTASHELGADDKKSILMQEDHVKENLVASIESAPQDLVASLVSGQQAMLNALSASDREQNFPPHTWAEEYFAGVGEVAEDTDATGTAEGVAKVDEVAPAGDDDGASGSNAPCRSCPAWFKLQVTVLCDFDYATQTRFAGAVAATLDGEGGMEFVTSDKIVLQVEDADPNYSIVHVAIPIPVSMADSVSSVLSEPSFSANLALSLASEGISVTGEITSEQVPNDADVSSFGMLFDTPPSPEFAEPVDTDPVDDAEGSGEKSMYVLERAGIAIQATSAPTSLTMAPTAIPSFVPTSHTAILSEAPTLVPTNAPTDTDAPEDAPTDTDAPTDIEELRKAVGSVIPSNASAVYAPIESTNGTPIESNAMLMAEVQSKMDQLAVAGAVEGPVNNFEVTRDALAAHEPEAVAVEAAKAREQVGDRPNTVRTVAEATAAAAGKRVSAWQLLVSVGGAAGLVIMLALVARRQRVAMIAVGDKRAVIGYADGRSSARRWPSMLHTWIQKPVCPPVMQSAHAHGPPTDHQAGPSPRAPALPGGGLASGESVL